MPVTESSTIVSSDISDGSGSDEESDELEQTAGRTTKIVVADAGESLGLSLAPHDEGTAVYATNSEHPDKQAAVGMIFAAIVPHRKSLLGLQPKDIAVAIQKTRPPYTLFLNGAHTACSACKRP